jgi:hypothetical protein
MKSAQIYEYKIHHTSIKQVKTEKYGVNAFVKLTPL